MIDLPDSVEPALRFANPNRSPGPLDAPTATVLAGSAGEVVLVLDPDGVILDISAARRDLTPARDWIGRRWADTVTVESRPKIEEMLGTGRGRGWRQVTHVLGETSLPVRYRTIPLGDGGFLAVGRDLRAAAALQQRLLQVQQSLERDHMRVRQAEARYRMIFETSDDALIVTDASTARVREINPAAAALLQSDRYLNQPVVQCFASGDRDAVLGFLGAVAAGAAVPPLRVRLASGERVVTLTASVFRRDSGSFHLVRLDAEAATALPVAERQFLNLIERTPDAFVVTDSELRVTAANPAFAELAQAASAAQLRGRALGDFLGRPGIDLDLIVAQLGEHAVVRNVATILFGVDGGQEEVEVSAARIGAPRDEYGFCIRAVGRRLRDLPVQRELPRSVEQLTELVGRMPLKSIVRESTDLIERLCIEAALAFTADNRASAAEILGLSRQSLYSKLHRHGLGNLAADPEPST